MQIHVSAPSAFGRSTIVPASSSEELATGERECRAAQATDNDRPGELAPPADPPPANGGRRLLPIVCSFFDELHSSFGSASMIKWSRKSE